MRLDNDVKKRIIDRTKRYLKKNGIPYKYVKVRNGQSLIIVEKHVMDDIVTKGTAKGRYMAETDKGWTVYVNDGKLVLVDTTEKLSEVNATRYALGDTIGHTPRKYRYMMA